MWQERERWRQRVRVGLFVGTVVVLFVAWWRSDSDTDVIQNLLHPIDAWFSVSNYWQRVRETNATLIDPMGTMFTLLYQQPPSAQDKLHKARAAWGAARKDSRSLDALASGYGPDPALCGLGCQFTPPSFGCGSPKRDQPNTSSS